VLAKKAESEALVWATRGTWRPGRSGFKTTTESICGEEQARMAAGSEFHNLREQQRWNHGK